MVKLGCSFSGKPGKDPGEQDGVTTDSVPLISPLDVSQLQPPFPEQVRGLGQRGGPSQPSGRTEGCAVRFIWLWPPGYGKASRGRAIWAQTAVGRR